MFPLQSSNANYKKPQKVRDGWNVKKLPNNIILSGLNVADIADETLLKRKIAKYFFDTFGRKVRVKRARKVSGLLCVAELESMQDKIMLMRATSRHYNRNGHVCIYADRALRERIMLTGLTKKAEKEIRKGNEVRFGFMKLYVNNEILRWSDIKQKMVKVWLDLVQLPARSNSTTSYQTKLSQNNVLLR